MEKPDLSSSRSDLARIARAVRRALLPALSILLPLLFLWVYLILVQPTGLSASGTVLPADSTAPFRTETAFFVYAVLLAGMIGSLLKHVLIRSREPAKSAAGPTLVDTGVFLFVGTIAAFAVAVLLPTALLVRDAPRADLFEPVNKWGLIVLASAVGYASRETLSKVAATFKRLFEEAGGPGLADLESKVEAGLKKAIAPAPLRNFEGKVELRLRDSAGNSCSGDGETVLTADKAYRLAVSIKSAQSGGEIEGSSLILPLAVAGGIDAAEVPFELIVDAGSLAVPLMRQSIIVPVSAPEVTAWFDFVPREHKESGTTGDETANASGRAEFDKPMIHLFVYQGSVMCRSGKLPVRLVEAAAES